MAATSENGRPESLYTYDSFTGVGKQARPPRERHFLWWCAGAYQDLLKDCPSEQTKYAGLGGVLLATFALAALSAGYAIYSVFNDPVWAVVFAIVWGLIIFNFDRFLVSTMRKYGVTRQKQLWMATPRIALALLIGFTIARPLELKIFEKEIDVQMTEKRNKKMRANDSLLQAERRSALARESSVFWTSLLISLLIILIETGPVLSKLIMNTGPYDLALAGIELKQMAAAEEDMRRDKELVKEKKTAIYGQKKEMTAELLQKLAALQKKHVHEELDQWEKGEDTIPGRMPLGDVTRRIRQRYDFREEDVL